MFRKVRKAVAQGREGYGGVCNVFGICVILTYGCEVKVTFSSCSRNYFGEVNEQAVYI
jgi:hypothetical protein